MRILAVPSLKTLVPLGAAAFFGYLSVRLLIPLITDGPGRQVCTSSGGPSGITCGTEWDWHWLIFYLPFLLAALLGLASSVAGAWQSLHGGPFGGPSLKTLSLGALVAFLGGVAVPTLLFMILTGPLTRFCASSSGIGMPTQTQCQTDVDWGLLIPLASLAIGSLTLLVCAIPPLLRSMRRDRQRAVFP